MRVYVNIYPLAYPWWFSVLDIVGAINQQDDHTKNRNYWKYLKTKSKKENSELVSHTTQLKLTASDGKKYNTDVISQDGVDKLAKATHNQQAMVFLDWFTYSDNTIDGQSIKKAYTLWESNLVATDVLPASGEDCFMFTDNFIRITLPISAHDNASDNASNNASDHVSVQVEKLVSILTGEMGRSELQGLLSIKNRDYFRTDYLNPAISNGYVELTIPDKPNSRNQKYRLTAKGIALKNSLTNNK